MIDSSSIPRSTTLAGLLASRGVAVPGTSDRDPVHQSDAESYLSAEYGLLAAWVAQILWRKLAHAGMSPESVLHELFLRLRRQTSGWNSKHHLINWVCRAVNHILIDAIRKRRIGPEIVEDPTLYSSAANADSDRSERDYFVRDALSRMAQTCPRQAAVVSMRHFEGYTIPECASRLHISERTVKRDAQSAYAWLRRELAG